MAGKGLLSWSASAPDPAMPQPPPSPRPAVTPPWCSALRAWPGVLTLLSVLAVVLGHPTHTADGSGPRLTASNVTPTLPELRPAPQPAPGPGLLAAIPPEPPRPPGIRGPVPLPVPAWVSPTPPRSLALLGRRQTDGG